MWLFGYDAEGKPLTEKQSREDFSPEHLGSTVTFETHPHLGYSCASIHPCKCVRDSGGVSWPLPFNPHSPRHADAMKNMIDLLVGSKAGLDPKVYLLIFLKFIQVGVSRRAAFPLLQAFSFVILSP